MCIPTYECVSNKSSLLQVESSSQHWKTIIFPRESPVQKWEMKACLCIIIVRSLSWASIFVCTMLINSSAALDVSWLTPLVGSPSFRCCVCVCNRKIDYSITRIKIMIFIIVSLLFLCYIQVFIDVMATANVANIIRHWNTKWANSRVISHGL